MHIQSVPAYKFSTCIHSQHLHTNTVSACIQTQSVPAYTVSACVHTQSAPVYTHSQCLHTYRQHLHPNTSQRLHTNTSPRQAHELSKCHCKQSMFLCSWQRKFNYRLCCLSPWVELSAPKKEVNSEMCKGVPPKSVMQ